MRKENKMKETEEFKLRAWDDYGKIMFNSISEMAEFEEHLIYWLNNAAYVLMRYTGSTDKNGKDIFQEDIVKVLGKNEEEYITNIFYQDGGLFIEVHDNSEYDYTSVAYSLINDIEEIEVIGNTYQNPELLKGE